MSQRKLSVEVNKFNKGLVGSASPVDFPIDAASVMKNFIIEKDGSLRKRGGLYRAHYYTTTLGNYANKDQSRSYGILRNPAGVDGFLLLSDMQRGSQPISEVFYCDNLTGNVSRVPVVDDETFVPYSQYSNICSASQSYNNWYATKRGNGVTARSISCRYDPTSNRVLVRNQVDNIKIRDSWGAYPDLDSSYFYDTGASITPSALAAARYNAKNRGFSTQDLYVQEISGGGAYGFSGVPGKSFSPHLTASINNDYDESKQAIPLTSAPRGRVIFNMFEFSRFVEAASDTYSIAGTSATTLGPSRWTGADVFNVAWGGRIFYWSIGAAIDSSSSSTPEPTLPNPNSMILFSQVVDVGDAHYKCYSFNDPTAGITTDGDLQKYAQPVETDGGVIVIEGTGDIISLVPFANSLVVFAENGIWEVTGPFSPINYGVNKVSEVRCVDSKSIVVLESQVIFMGDNSINAIKMDLRSRSLFVEDISTASLSDIYLDRYKFDSSNSNNWSAYNSEDGVVQWATVDRSSFFSQGTVKILCFDVALSAFYEKEFILPPMTLLTGMYDDPIRERGIVYVIESYISNGGFGNAEVGLYFEGTGLTDDITYYRLSDLQKLTANNPVVAELETGAASFGDASKSKNAPYISMYFKQTEGSYDEAGVFDRPTSCLMQLKWDFSRSGDTGKWTDEKEMYRLKRFNYPDTSSFDYGYDVVVTKNKIRGRGKALRIKLTVPEGKTCHLYGWNFSLLANSEV